MSSDERTVGQQQPRERPEPSMPDDETSDEPRTSTPLLDIPAGGRRTDHVWMLLVEAELVADGVDLANPARPASETAAKAAIEQLEADGLTPAWRVVETGADR